jgi:hypothetical protein
MLLAYVLIESQLNPNQKGGQPIETSQADKGATK